MNILTQPEAITFWADHYDGGWHPWPFFWIFPLLFWAAIIVFFVARRRFWGHQSGIGVLRTAFARGEITEQQYRSRLAVLRERGGKPRGGETPTT
ncbi:MULTISPECIES: SHOCT domain-containing protein [unclassified Nocardia]|uniref:SHOCT domain-containing protein n=1 Tax=unclassified Nocardia TaxID=2637762 RepID=UPI00341431CC